MSQESFYMLFIEIKDHQVFRNDSNHSQAPTEWQLLVALAHLGINGNGGSPHILREVFNISEGSVENYTNRCLRAIADLEDRYVKWPSAADRANYRSKPTSYDFFDDAVGLVDGTIFPLAFAPTVHKEDFWM
ncbi:hypothetical protein PTTG_28694 [Puccinia triticina 1-1 BBBD Race 1]|uniref:DDE Tnp4 domain-containing protein n=1 Tax=Puccinia triticina (isolate 1-1 / race 1 (BBBD)) TaxID=630390 RepID=A0A180G9T7_PUCT1|nr:hypothetical protein PTTG_28694 [Puccinia triticina 1-1 BBBD Race 1]